MALKDGKKSHDPKEMKRELDRMLTPVVPSDNPSQQRLRNDDY